MLTFPSVEEKQDDESTKKATKSTSTSAAAASSSSSTVGKESAENKMDTDGVEQKAVSEMPTVNGLNCDQISSIVRYVQIDIFVLLYNVSVIGIQIMKMA